MRTKYQTNEIHNGFIKPLYSFEDTLTIMQTAMSSGQDFLKELLQLKESVAEFTPKSDRFDSNIEFHALKRLEMISNKSSYRGIGLLNGDSGVSVETTGDKLTFCQGWFQRLFPHFAGPARQGL